MPKTGCSLITFIAAVIVLCFALWQFGQRRNGEDIYLLLVGAAGSFIFLVILAVPLAGDLAAPDTDSLYPYDYVCMAYPEDEELFEEISDEELATVVSVPMARVTTVQGDKTTWEDVANNYFQKVIWPQGQHIAVSESSYKEMCDLAGVTAEDLDLKEDEIHIVYQEDYSQKAHPLEWYMDRVMPYVRIGQPLSHYLWIERAKNYPPRTVSSEERAVLTGVFANGTQEDIIVFSDDYFESLDITEGPTTLYLIKTTEGKAAEVQAMMEQFGAEHEEDSSWDRRIADCYSKEDKSADMTMERILKETSLILEMALLLLCVFLLFFMKIEFERKEREKKYKLLFFLGTSKSLSRQTMFREVWRFFMPPLMLAYILSAVVTGIIFKLRIMNMTEIISYSIFLLGIWMIYLLIQLLSIWVMCRKMEA